MKKFIVSAVIAFGVSSFSFAQGDVDAGKSKSAMCGACHGIDGNSPAPNFPKLAGQNAKYLLKQMNDIKGGARSVPMMAGQLDNMSEQDLTDIASYFAAQKINFAKAKPELVAKGESIYRGGSKEKGMAACSACHSPTGQGNSSAGFPALGGQHEAYLVAQLKAFRTGAEDDVVGRHNDGDTRMMRDVAYRLSDKEIEAVANFISALH